MQALLSPARIHVNKLLQSAKNNTFSLIATQLSSTVKVWRKVQDRLFYLYISFSRFLCIDQITALCNLQVHAKWREFKEIRRSQIRRISRCLKGASVECCNSTWSHLGEHNLSSTWHFNLFLLHVSHSSLKNFNRSYRAPGFYCTQVWHMKFL